VLGQKESALRRAATFFEEFIYSMHEARFNSKKKTSLSLLKASSSLPTISENNSNNKGNESNDVKEIGNLLKSRLNLTSSSNQENNEIEDKKNPIAVLAQSKAHDLVSTLSLDDDAELKLKRLQEILKPYIENKVDVSLLFVNLICILIISLLFASASFYS
jgi:hypothetical protein